MTVTMTPEQWEERMRRRPPPPPPFDPVVGGALSSDSTTVGTQSGNPPPSLSTPPGARFSPYPGPISPWTSEFPARIHIDLPAIRTKIAEFTHITRDLAYLNDYHRRVSTQMNEHQRAWLQERVPHIGQGVHSCWDGKWRNKNDIEIYMQNLKGELMASRLWDSEDALDLFVVITSQ